MRINTTIKKETEKTESEKKQEELDYLSIETKKKKDFLLLKKDGLEQVKQLKKLNKLKLNLLITLILIKDLSLKLKKQMLIH